jgi:DNA-directed RNA polymerase specialized sigma24 family protein
MSGGNVHRWQSELGSRLRSRDRRRTRLAVLTHGRAVEWVRRERAAAAEQTQVADADPGGPGGFSDAEEPAEALATAGRVQGALADLGPEHRLALEVTYFGGNTCQQAAAMLGVPGDVVAERVRAALRHLSRWLPPAVPDHVQAVSVDDGERVDPDAAR